MSIFRRITKHLLFLFECHRLYYKGEPREPSTTEHIASGMVFALVIILFGCVSLYCLLAYPLVWGYYAPFVEFVLDKEKNKGRPVGEVWAQVLERSAGFVLAMPFIGVCFL